MVELLHDYYSNRQCRDFEVIPSDDTRQLMSNRQMLFRTVGNKLVVLVKVNISGPDKDKPFIQINPNDKFLFYLQLNKPQFNIVTNLDTDKLRLGKRYYFTNLHQNDIDANLNLTRKIQQVAGPAFYTPGDFTADGSNVVYECIKSTNETHNPPSAFWYDRGKQQYVSGADMITIKTRVENFTLSTPAQKFVITVLGMNISTGQYDKIIPVQDSVVITDQDTDQVQVKLQDLSPGRYKVKINTDEFDLFIDDAVVYSNAFGIIEIFSHFANGTSFAFLDNAGKIKDKISGLTPEWLRYKIHFANRLAYWQYNTPRHGVSAITDSGLTYTFNAMPVAPGDKDFFTSDKPIPLLETPWKFKVNVQSLASAEDPMAPNPDPNISGILSRNEIEKDYYCTINLNY